MKTAVGVGKSVNFNANLRVKVDFQSKRSKDRKTFGIKLLMLWKN